MLIDTLEINLPENKRFSIGTPARLAKLTLYFDSESSEIISVSYDLGKSLHSKPLMFPMDKKEFLEEIMLREKKLAFEKICNFIKRRDYATEELKQKLRLDGYHENSIEAAIQKATTYSIIDDKRFTDAFIRQKLNKGWGKNKITYALSEKNISSEMINILYDENCELSEFDRASLVLRKKVVPNKNPYEKLCRFLYNRGFSSDVSHQAVQAYLNNSTNSYK